MKLSVSMMMLLLATLAYVRIAEEKSVSVANMKTSCVG
jgi:hypothetical protein